MLDQQTVKGAVEPKSNLDVLNEQVMDAATAAQRAADSSQLLVIIAFVDLLIVVGAGYFVFQVPIKGSLLQLAVFSLLYLVSSLGTGVFVSTIADNMQTAMLAAIFISLMPSILLSGFVFPLENMPIGVRVVSYFFPGRYFVTAIRGIYLKGVGISVLWPEAALLVCFSVGVMGLSASRFQDKLG